MNTCIECKHVYIPGIGVIVAEVINPAHIECKHTEAITRDVVTGRCLCQHERAATGKKGCGKAGRLWAKR